MRVLNHIFMEPREPKKESTLLSLHVREVTKGLGGVTLVRDYRMSPST